MAAKRKSPSRTKKKRSTTTRRAVSPARSRSQSQPQVPAWARYWKPVAVVAAMALAVWWVGLMVVVWEQREATKELTSKPATALWFQQQRVMVEGEGGPESLWVGAIKEVVHSQPVNPTAAPRLVKVVFEEGLLLAGTGKKKVKDLPVYVYGHRFDGSEPAAGERWVVSVWLDEEGNRKIHAGLPFE